MSLHEQSDGDIITGLLVEEIRRLDDDARKERMLKSEVIARYERAVTDKRELETRVAMLEAELKRERTPKPDPFTYVQIGKAP